MSAWYLLGIALAVAGSVTACGDAPSDSLGNGLYRLSSSGSSSSMVPKLGGDPGVGPTPVDQGTTPDTEAKKFFLANVHPSLSQSCGGCHETGPGSGWIKKTDSETSYKMMFQLGYVSLQSRISQKGAHQGSPGTTSEQNTKFTQWVQMELKAGGGKAPRNVLARLGACFDKAKFDAMQLGRLRTIRRTNNNNLNQVTPWNENANNCTGCDNSPCRTCHAGDDATGFVLAIGDTNLPANFTFDQSKLTNPPYLQKYFGVTATGEPIASNALKIKAEATAKDKAYTHPYFTISDQRQALIQAFVDDAIARYKATNGACQ